ncbi:MAG TPA: 8-amino-7-oxononanoate synthase [Tepidisphaeraceae bacterium]|jgi:8-amino-7-oxononanoate synthase|nr:8-amino-7-oxononanoate synthase [Tepidisphaeraceae bacterium]
MSEAVPRWNCAVAAHLNHLRQTHLFRARSIVIPIDATHVQSNGRRLVNFSSNNYLGLTHHPKVVAAAASALARDGFGSGAAPLITGYSRAHHCAEQAIARWKGSETAVLFPSGYQANLAAIQTIAAIGKLSQGVRFLVDKLAHASLIDAIRGSGEMFRVFPHNGIAKLARLLDDAPADQLQVVVTESIFSMDGDAADLAAIAKLKDQHGFFLLLDEAHATGVYGPAGAGLAAEMSLRDMVDVSVITLSKALGGIGGAVCTSEIFRDAIMNHGRGYLFSTAIPACVAAAGEAAVQVLHEEPGRQMRVRALARRVREEIAALRFAVPAGDSPIIPIILGSEQSALTAAAQLLEAGMLVMPVRPPTVARGSSRLRVTLSSEHTDEEVDQLIGAIRNLAGS